MNVALYFKDGTTPLVRDKRMIPVDSSSPLVQMISTMQRTFTLPEDLEFSFQYADTIDDAGNVINRTNLHESYRARIHWHDAHRPLLCAARWLHTQSSLAEQEGTWHWLYTTVSLSSGNILAPINPFPYLTVLPIISCRIVPLTDHAT